MALPRPPFSIPAALESPPLNDLSGNSSGSSTVSNTWFDVDLVDWAIPLQVGFGGQGVDELAAGSVGRASVTGTLQLVYQLSGTSAGSAYVAPVPPASGSYSDLVVGDSPQYYWKLDELVSTTAVDQMGNQDLTWTNSPPRLGAGNGAIYDETVVYSGSGFGTGNTTSQHVSTSATLPKATDDFSVEFWFKFPTLTGTYYQAWRHYPASPNSLGWIIPDGSWNFQVNVSGVGLRGISYQVPSKSYTDWYHIVYVVSFTDSLMYIYLNGVEVANTSLPGTTSTTTGSGFYIGMDGGSSYAFKGALDEFALYHRALDPAIIAKHYETGLDGNNGIGFYNVSATEPALSGSTHGQATVTAVLGNGANDGNDNPIQELAGSLAGSSTVSMGDWPFLKVSQPDYPRTESFLYLYSYVIAGFDPTDDASARSDFVSQGYPDGNVRDDFDRWLYLYSYAITGFRDTDDVSARTDLFHQHFPDGSTIDSWDRFLHLLLNVVYSVSRGEGQLVIRPGWSPRTSPAVPPAGKYV